MLTTKIINKQKKIYLVFVLVISFTTSNAQWRWLHPSPQGNDLYVSSFANANNGWCAGAGGAILKTTDGGNTWSSQNSGFFDQAAGIYFPTASIGYLAMQYNFLKTTNGGTTWNVLYRYSDLYAQTMYFLNKDTGWVAGVFNGIYLLQQTMDGGVTWNIQANNLSDQIRSIQVNTNGTGWAAGRNGIYMQTSNYGATWTTSSPVGANTINSLNFPDQLNGYMVGDAGVIYKSTDGGQTWNSSFNPIGNINLKSVCFTSANIGCIGGESGNILYTINGGTSWQSANQSAWFTGNNVISFNGTDLLMVGSSGEILKSTNSGQTWISKQVRVSDKNLNGVSAPTSTTIFASGNNGTILTSSNAGLNWQLLNSGSSTNFNDIASLSATNVSVVGDSGKIYNTTNGGTLWTLKTSPVTDDLYGICKASATRMFACGNNEALIRSNNSGSTWQLQSTPLSGIGFKFLDVFFVSADTGWIATDGFEILYTVDGGVNWGITSTTFSAGISSVFYINKLHGWACTIYGDILESTDGGLTYNLLLSKVGSKFDKIVFTDAQNGWVFGNGKIYRTADGGLTWSQEFTPSGQLVSDAVFLNGNEAIAVGNGLSSIIGRSGDLRLGISDTLLCTDNVYTSTVNSTGTFNAGNKFIVEISDEFGNFDYPFPVGSINATGNTPVLVSIPSGLPDGNAYRLRVVSTNPPIISPVNNKALTLHNSPNAFAYTLTPTAFCQGDSVTIYAINSSAWTYQWYMNSIPISGATADSITVFQTGDYTVNANDGICDYTSSIVDVLVVICVGLAEISHDPNYHAYPNPTKGNLTLDWNKGITVNQIILRDVTGRIINSFNNINNNQQEIDLSLLQSGIYFITTIGSKPSTIKVIRY